MGGGVRSGPDGYLRPVQFLDHLTVIKNNFELDFVRSLDGNQLTSLNSGNSPSSLCRLLLGGDDTSNLFSFLVARCLGIACTNNLFSVSGTERLDWAQENQKKTVLTVSPLLFLLLGVRPMLSKITPLLYYSG